MDALLLELADRVCEVGSSSVGDICSELLALLSPQLND